MAKKYDASLVYQLTCQNVGKNTPDKLVEVLSYDIKHMCIPSKLKAT
jgi:hypothetical protein